MWLSSRQVQGLKSYVEGTAKEPDEASMTLEVGGVLSFSFSARRSRLDQSGSSQLRS